MKITKTLAAFLMLPILAGCGGTSEPQIGDELVWDDYKKVSVTVDVEVTPNPDVSTDMMTCSGSGAFLMDFWFAPGGGDPMHQESSWQLTGYECYAFGDVTSCTGTPNDEAWEMRDIEVTGKLAPTDEEDIDVLTYHVSELPTDESIMVEYLCEAEHATAGTKPDAAVLTQIVLPLYQEFWQTDVMEESTDISTRADIDLSGMSLADVTTSVTMERVSSTEE